MVTAEAQRYLNEWIAQALNAEKKKVSSSDPLSPSTFAEFVGQERAKKLASISVTAALKNKALPNILVSGAFGQGKTSLARLTADAYQTSAIPILDASSVNKDPPEKGIFIIDEIHNLDSKICDSFNILMDAQKLRIIGCTTSPGSLPSAFKSRFRQIVLEPYTAADITRILTNVIKRKGVSVSPTLIKDTAARSRNTPRIALNYLMFILDVGLASGGTAINSGTIKEAFNYLGVDSGGFTSRDYAFMEALPEDGTPVGLQYISAMISVDQKTIEEEIEPYLMQQGLLDRTSKGRRKIQNILTARR